MFKNKKIHQFQHKPQCVTFAAIDMRLKSSWYYQYFVTRVMADEILGYRQQPDDTQSL
jgi:hypothetical protein